MLVLASASPRRQELLRAAGVEFVVQPADVPEVPRPGEDPRAYAERLAREKAMAVFRQRPSDLVLGADTVVIVDQHILEKPRDAADAVRMLRMLSGKDHQVITGVCLVGISQGLKPSAAGLDSTAKAVHFYDAAEGHFEDVRSEMTRVTFSALSEDDIRDYVATGEPMDKAGAYAIQGVASRWISRIDGDYCNVVGLPVALVWRMMKESGME
jgi:septum formation protein